MAIRMRQVLLAWALSSEMHRPTRPGVTAEDLARAERLLGRTLPGEVRELYLTFNGGGFVNNNLNIDPLFSETGETLALTNASDLLRSWQWPIPDELAIFASDGSDNLFGLWLPRGEVARPLAIEVGEGGEPGSLVVVGDDLPSFLAARTACILSSYAVELGTEVGPALDALGVPDELRALSLDELEAQEGMARFLCWASPGLPDPHPDPYSSRGLTGEQIAVIARERR